MKSCRGVVLLSFLYILVVSLGKAFRGRITVNALNLEFLQYEDERSVYEEEFRDVWYHCFPMEYFNEGDGKEKLPPLLEKEHNYTSAIADAVLNDEEKTAKKSRTHCFECESSGHERTGFDAEISLFDRAKHIEFHLAKAATGMSGQGKMGFVKMWLKCYLPAAEMLDFSNTTRQDQHEQAEAEFAARFEFGDLDSYSYCALCLPSGRAEALLTADRYLHIKHHLELQKQENATIRTRSGRIVRNSNAVAPVADENFDEQEFLEMWKSCYGRTDLQKGVRQEELREPQQRVFKTNLSSKPVIPQQPASTSSAICDTMRTELEDIVDTVATTASRKQASGMRIVRMTLK